MLDQAHDQYVLALGNVRTHANGKLGMEALAVLKPGQWDKLITRLGKIDNPVVPTKPSKYAIRVKRRTAHLPGTGD